MDSQRPHPPSAARVAAPAPVVADAPSDTDLATAEAMGQAPPGALAKLGRLLPGVEAVARFAYRVAGLSAVSAGLIVWALIDTVGERMVTSDAVILGFILCLPAIATALAGWTITDLARLPGQIRDAALSAARDADAARVAKGSRIGRLVRSLWAARGLALLTRGGWAKAIGALRFVRLASLPFALALVGAVAFNAVVIAGGVVAVLILLF